MDSVLAKRKKKYFFKGRGGEQLRCDRGYIFYLGVEENLCHGGEKGKKRLLSGTNIYAYSTPLRDDVVLPL